jgi:hypothetical protein
VRCSTVLVVTRNGHVIELLDATVRDLSATLLSPPDTPDVGATALLRVDVRAQECTLSFFSTLTTLGAPQDVTLQELRIEAFHPSDAATESVARRHFDRAAMA